MPRKPATRPAIILKPNRALEARIASLEQQLHVERRRAFVEEAIGTGRIDESEVESIESAYDADPAATAAIVSSRPVRVAVARKMSEKESAGYQAEAPSRLGLTAGKVV